MCASRSIAKTNIYGRSLSITASSLTFNGAPFRPLSSAKDVLNTTVDLRAAANYEFLRDAYRKSLTLGE